jgi:hypothetical protein
MPATPNPSRKDTTDEPGALVEFPKALERTRPRHNLPLQLST